jgi:hypothetical protein
MKIVCGEIIVACGQFRGGWIKEEIIDKNGKKVKPYKKEQRTNPHRYDICHYRLLPGEYVVVRTVRSKNKKYGILRQVIKINDTEISIEDEKYEGNLPPLYLKNISVP